MAEHMVPFGPLELRLRRRWGCDTEPGEARQTGDWSDSIGAAQLGVTRTALTKWRQLDLTVGQAETAAAALNVHPSDIWGADVYERLWSEDAAARSRVCPGCGEQFTPDDPRGKFCGEPTCSSAASRKLGVRRATLAPRPLAAIA